MEANKNAASRHVAVLAFPFGTHAAPLLSLIRQLSESCPATVFSFLNTRQSNATTFHDEVDEVIKPFNVCDGLPEGYRFKGNPHEPVEHFAKVIPGNYTKVIDEAVTEIGRPIDCLITDAFYAFGADIADELNVPWVALWTAGPRALLVQVVADVIRKHAEFNGPQDRLLDFLPEFSSIRVADLPEGIVFGNPNTPIASLLHKMGHTLSRATAIVVNSYEDLDYKIVGILKSRYDKFLNVGPFNLISSASNPVEDSHGCLNWLSMKEPASVVYISFGSMMTPPPHELEALSEALEETEFPFLWSFRGDPEKELPLGFLERTSSRGKIVPWAPQKKILEHASVGVFLSHGGWNSVLESIGGGVPMILRPFFGDQRLNTRAVEAVWEFGLGLEGGVITKQGTKKALNLILCGGEGKKMREKIGVQNELAYMAVKPEGGSVQNLQALVKIVGGA